MTATIRTNQLIHSINREEFAKKYEIYSITTRESEFKPGAYILDTPLVQNNICSVLYEFGKQLFILMKADTGNTGIIKRIVSEAEDAEHLSWEKISIMSSSLGNRIIISLLLNALSNVESPSLRFNNLTGHLYCYEPAWLKRSKNGQEIWQVPCIEIKVDFQCRLTMAVRTFSSVKLQSSMTFDEKRPLKTYNRYILSYAHMTLRRKLSTDNGKTEYILKQINNKKTEIPFIDLHSLEEFQHTKMGVLENIMVMFNQQYQGIAEIQFNTIQNYESHDMNIKEGKETHARIQQLLQETKVGIVDMIQNETSAEVCERFRATVNIVYGCEIKVWKNIHPEAGNIVLVHEADYYESEPEEKDPYSEYGKGTVVQHITLEKMLEKEARPGKKTKKEGNWDEDLDEEDTEQEITLICTSIVKAVVQELMIKKDIKRGNISIYDWSSLQASGEIIFGMVAPKEGSKTTVEMKQYYFMTIQPDGTFSIAKKECKLGDSDIYQQCIFNMDLSDKAKLNQEGQMKLRESEEAIGIISDSNGNASVIRGTEMYTIPEIEKIRQELKNGNNKLRGKSAREEYLTSVTDIKTFEHDGDQYYFVGVRGNGMQNKIAHAANIRAIETVSGNVEMSRFILPLMDVSFVSNGKLTVLPFPFKYLREYIKMQRQA